MEIKNKEVDLDQPAYVPDAPAGVVKEEPETKVEEKEAKPAVEEETNTEKPRVPYSRFENVAKARREAEEEAERWKKRALELEESRFSQPKTEEIPAWWVKLAGDNDASKEGYRAWLQGQQEVAIKARQEALEAVKAEQRQAEEIQQRNLKTLDDGLETLAISLGRDLTDKEESDILDIVDEYTPKDAQGDYLGAPISFDKAWEIYELKNQAVKAPRQKARDSAAQAISAPSSGQPAAEQQEKDKNFQPGRWGNWMHRFKGQE